ncbi:Lrp/AsnC family transcriptional regulator [Candidatus Pacearchaeota archaeon]|nr:Lrp/AsnC family transcriptional regulator [Candidatus Pacearchaeota archaeon]
MEETRLDLKDKKILAEIEMNARISHSLLAKKVGLSKQVVKYRIENLERDKIIQGYNAIIDLNKLGYTIYLIYLKLIKITSEKEKIWIKEISNNKNVIAVGKNAGYWDMSIVLRCRNNQELDETFKKVIQGKADKIQEKLVTSELESSYFNLKLLHKIPDIAVKTSFKPEDSKIDEEDDELLHFLSENCRTNLVDLAVRLKMSANGVKNRIKNLEKKGIIIGHKTKINYEKLGYLHFRVFLHVNKFSKELYEKVTDFLKTKGNVESVSRYMGYADMEFRCYSKNILELYDLISEVKDNFVQDIIKIDSMPIFGWEKIEYF